MILLYTLIINEMKYILTVFVEESGFIAISYIKPLAHLIKKIRKIIVFLLTLKIVIKYRVIAFYTDTLMDLFFIFLHSGIQFIEYIRNARRFLSSYREAIPNFRVLYSGIWFNM